MPEAQERPLGFYLTKAGKDVTLIARGAHLKALSEQGLTMDRLWNGTRETILVKAVDMEHYDEQPDVILVCVKGYSLDDTVPFIRKVMKKNTIVIPILNIYGTGGKLQKQLPEILVTDGCIYVAAAIKEPGVLEQYGKVLSLVFGVRDQSETRPELEEIRADLESCGIRTLLSHHIQRASTGEILLCVTDRCGWLIL